MKGKDLLLIGAGVFILIQIAKRNTPTQTAVIPTTAQGGMIRVPTTQLEFDIGGGGVENAGSGDGIFYYENGFNPAASAWNFAHWLDSIPIGYNLAAPGVIQATVE